MASSVSVPFGTPALVDRSIGGKIMAMQVIAQRVYFRLNGEGQRARVFMGTTKFSERQWREGVAVAEFGDFKRWQEVEFIGVRPIMSED
jgi:hypothetical protein